MKSKLLPSEKRRHRGRSDTEFGMLYALAGSQRVGKAAEFARRPLYQQHLKVVIVLKMHVGRGDDHEIILVLDIGEFSLEIPFPVIVNKADGSSHAPRPHLPGMFGQLFASHLGNRVRTVRKFAPHHHVVEFIEQV